MNTEKKKPSKTLIILGAVFALVLGRLAYQGASGASTPERSQPPTAAGPSQAPTPPAPPATGEAGTGTKNAEPAQGAPSQASKPDTTGPDPTLKLLGWQQTPAGTLEEMEERFAQLKELHRRASELPRVAKRKGLEAAGVEMRDVQRRCRNDQADYQLRFGPALLWVNTEPTAPKARAHVAMSFAFEVCAMCPTLSPEAPDACKRARVRLDEARGALARWRKLVGH